MDYRKVQGFRVEQTWELQTPIATRRIIRTDWVDLVEGLLVMKKGFCFEPSGPTIKTKSIMQGCCAHDAVYYLIRNGYLEPLWKEFADDLMHVIHIEDGVTKLRASYFRWFVQKFGDPSIDPRNRNRVLTAP